MDFDASGIIGRGPAETGSTLPTLVASGKTTASACDRGVEIRCSPQCMRDCSRANPTAGLGGRSSASAQFGAIGQRRPAPEARLKCFHTNDLRTLTPLLGPIRSEAGLWGALRSASISGLDTALLKPIFQSSRNEGIGISPYLSPDVSITSISSGESADRDHRIPPRTGSTPPISEGLGKDLAQSA